GRPKLAERQFDRWTHTGHDFRSGIAGSRLVRFGTVCAHPPAASFVRVVGGSHHLVRLQRRPHTKSQRLFGVVGLWRRGLGSMAACPDADLAFGPPIWLENRVPRRRALTERLSRSAVWHSADH